MRHERARRTTDATSGSSTPALRVAIRQCLRVGASAIALGMVPASNAGPFPAVLELSSLSGSDGFAINGIHDIDYAGRAVGAAGDVNGDGYDDLLIGAPNAAPGDVVSAGEIYVVFGSGNVGAGGVLELAALDGGNGFAIRGIAEGDHAGFSVAGVGDINDDGFDDVLISAPYADNNSGVGYVVFGDTDVGSAGTLDLSALDGSNGFAIVGFPLESYSGWSMQAAGDVNGDGVGDLIIGAPGTQDASASYVIFGRAGIGSGGVLDIDTLSGPDGSRLVGFPAYTRSGIAVSGAGDVDADGFDDILIGADQVLPGPILTGAALLVRGGVRLGQNGMVALGLLNGTDGFALRGNDAYDFAGRAVSGADVNGDGFSDLLVGGQFVNVGDDGTDTGRCYVLFGRASLDGPADRYLQNYLNGDDGFGVDGVSRGDRACQSLAAGDDVNGDGVDDFIVGTDHADPDDRNDAGESYVVFGASLIGAGGSLALADLDGDNGFAMRGIHAFDHSGAVSRAGDVNGDGVGDLIVGAQHADPHDLSEAGQSYVVFGRAVDTDDDGVPDGGDNCTLVANADQRDTNGDGYGNVCDADLDDNGIVNFTDLGLLKTAFFTHTGDPDFDPDADFNGDGAINFADLALMKTSFFGPPGPSGLVEHAKRPARR